MPALTSYSVAFRPAAVVFHALSALHMAYGYSSLDSTPIDAWIQTLKGGRFQFLTIQGLIVAWITMILSLVIDLFPWLPVLKNVKRVLFMAAMPVAVVVSLFYWVLLFAHPTMILLPDPKQQANHVAGSPVALAGPSLPVDLAIHITPVVTLFADFVWLERKYSKRASSYGAPLVAILWTVWYTLWVEYCAHHNGIFPYPFLNHPIGVRLAIYLAASALALLSFWLINGLHPDVKSKRT